jgi:hypothetical protein
MMITLQGLIESATNSLQSSEHVISVKWKVSECVTEFIVSVVVV